MHATRIDTGGAHLVLGCDLVVTASTEALAKMAPARTRAVVNASVTPTAEFVKNPNWQLPGSDLQRDIARSGAERPTSSPATELATGADGRRHRHQHVHARLRLPEGLDAARGESLERAIELNGVAVEFNKKSFLWGRRAAVDLERVQAHRHAGRGDPDRPALLAQPRRADRAAREVPDRLPERRLRGTLPRAGRPGAQGRAGKGRFHRSSPKRWRATTPSCSPTRTSTRSRGCTPTATSARRSRACSRATTRSCYHLAPPLLAQDRPAHRRAAQDALRRAG